MPILKMTYTCSRKKKRITKGRNQKSRGLTAGLCRGKTLSPSRTSTTPVSYLKQRCCNLPCRHLAHLLTPQSYYHPHTSKATPEAASLRPGAQPLRNNGPSGHTAPGCWQSLVYLPLSAEGSCRAQMLPSSAFFMFQVFPTASSLRTKPVSFKGGS